MRVILHSHSFLPAVGGVELYTDQLARRLAEKGIDVAVLTRTPDVGPSDRDRPYEVVRRPSGGTVRGLVAGSDLLHGNGFNLPAFREARRRRVPILWFHHDYDVICPKSIAWNGGASCHFSLGQCVSCLARDHSPALVARRLVAFAFKRSWVGSVTSHAVLTRYAKERMGLRDAVVIRSVPNLTIEGDACLPFRSGAGGNDPVVNPALQGRGCPARLLFVGRLIPEKGCDTLIGAVGRCRDAGVAIGLDVAGDGVERGRLERLALDLGIGERVRFLGALPPADVVALMRNALATVVPSLWDEVTGAVALEAMACGSPVVAADVGGLGEVVRGVGLLFPRGDAVALAELVIGLFREPELALDMRSRSKEAHSRVYNWPAAVNEYVDLYRTMLEPSVNPALQGRDPAPLP